MTTTHDGIAKDPTKGATLDAHKLIRDIEIIRKHQGIESLRRLAEIIGVSSSSLYGLAEKKGIDSITLVRIVHWGKFDLHEYIVDAPASAADVKPQLTALD